MAWLDIWQLTSKEDKSKVLNLVPGNAHMQYTMRRGGLEETDVERDLGIHIDASLNFLKQASAAAAKANQVLAVFKHSF